MGKRFLGFFVLLLFTGCSCSVSVDKNITFEEEQTTTVVKEDRFISINYSDFLSKYNSDSKFILFIGKDTCPTCIRFKSVLTSYSSDKKIDIYYLNVNELEESDFEDLNNYISVEYVPTFVIFNDKNISYSNVGYLSYEELDDVLNMYR